MDADQTQSLTIIVDTLEDMSQVVTEMIDEIMAVGLPQELLRSIIQISMSIRISLDLIDNIQGKE